MTKCSFSTCKRNSTGQTNVKRSGRLCACIANTVIVILAVFGVAAFFLRTYFNSYDDFYNFHKGDQISIQHIEADGFSSMLCDKYRVEPWTKADVYLLDSKAKIDKHHKKIVRKQLVHGPFIYNSYNFDGFYLLKHSEISVNACTIASPTSSMDVDVLLFKGKESWKKWKKHEKSTKHAIMTLPITGDDLCSEGKRTMKYKVKHTDHYYVVVAWRHEHDLHKQVSLNVDLLVERTTYELKNIKEFCPDTVKVCTLNLTYSLDEDVVIELHDDTFSNDAFFTTKCRLRVMFWVGIFAILPVLMIIFAVSCCCCCAACTRMQGSCDKQLLPVNYTDKAVLVINEQFPDKNQHLPEQQLPSYEFVIGAKQQVV